MKSIKLKKVVILNKKEGETPLEALGRFRAIHKKYEKVKMTYAGRLDPMASGLLLILLDKEVKSKEQYIKLDKEYEIEILFGFATDTYDTLGKITHSNILTNIRMKDIKNNAKFFVGKFRQKYPLYSSPTIKAARRGEKVITKSRGVVVKNIKFLNLRSMSSRQLLHDIEKRIKKVKGDFRQKEILKIWRKNLIVQQSVFNIASFKIKCGRGMYVRSLANSLGKKLGTFALAYRIKRTKIGKFDKIT